VKRAAFLLLAPLAVGAVLLACSTRDPFVTFGGGENEGGVGQPAPFVPSNEAGADAPPPGPPVRPPTSTAGLCIATDCPPPFASCTVFGALSPYSCATNTDTDPNNCGGCGKVCPRGSDAFHFQRNCVAGECQPSCVAEFSDCNGIPDDGCESNPKTDSKNCGVCGNACPAGVACVEGKCGCPAGQTNCDGVCIDLRDDDDNCGACGFKCADNQPTSGGDAGVLPPLGPNMFYGCHQSQCKTPRCFHDDNVFWVDCNNNLTVDGCEVDLKQPDKDNCGKCGNKCTAAQQCFSSSETGMDCQCKGNKTLCAASGFMPALCADLENDPMNCGSCGYTCPTIDDADGICVKGRCSYKCKPGRADCNGNSADGCEVDLSHDPRHCGTCGNTCDVGVGQPCTEGRCATVDCDGGIVK